jgi:signal transduction histidine kinase
VRDPVADHIRHATPRIVERWERAMRQVPDLHDMSRPVLLDHLHELLDGLAAWVEGNEPAALCSFDALVDGHALQRLGHGVGLETLLREYSTLRSLLATELLSVSSTPQVRASLVRLHDGFDLAIGEAVRRYARQRDQIRERFIAILGHDLRQPLSAIAACADLLSSDDSPGPGVVRQLAARIERAGSRMQRMISDVLDFARSNVAGGIPVDPSLNDLGEICRVAAEELAAAHADQVIHLDIRGDLRGAFDRDRILQALGNLLTNAREHGRGPLELRAYETAEGYAVIVEVTSYGAPIPEDLRRRVFEPFATTAPRRGLGLGLFIVQQIVRAHGGTSSVASDGDGTTFTLCFPRVPGEDRRAKAVAEIPAHGRDT